jgi:superfamily II DNA or RNA helicase
MKLGETQNPYERRNGYRTASVPEDPSSFQFLIKVKGQKKKVLKKIEHTWIHKFQKRVITPSSNTNILYSVETITYTSIFQIIEGFKDTLKELNLSNILEAVYLNDKEILNVFDTYEPQDDDSSDSDLSIQSTHIESYSGWPLRAYQIEDITETVNMFNSGSQRLYLDIACGLGKTLIGYEILRRLNQQFNVIITSRGKLVKQFCNDLTQNWKYPSEKVFTCCSDGCQGIVNINSYANLLEKAGTNQVILVTTYDSIEKMMGGNFGFAMYDEAHHLVLSTAKYDISGNIARNQRSLFDDCITIKYRLSVTATIKDVTYADLSGNEPKRTYKGFSHQPELFGVCVSKRDYLFGKQNGFLVPFIAVGCKIDDDSLKETMIRLRTAFGFTNDVLDSLETLLEKFTNGELNLDYVEQLDIDTKITRALQLWYAIVADCIINACEKFGTKRVITYHTSIKRAETFSLIFNLLIKTYKLTGKFSSQSVSSKNGGELNDTHLQNFATKQGTEIKVLSNCRTLIEGFDEKSVDLTVFVDNKYSPLECNQIVGRGNRIDKTNINKKHYVFIPFLCATSEAKERLQASNDYNLPRYILKNVLENTDPKAKIEQLIWVPKQKIPNDTDDPIIKPGNEIIYNEPKATVEHDRFIADKVTAVNTNELSAMHFRTARLWAHEMAKAQNWIIESDKNTESDIQKRWLSYTEKYALPEDIPYNPQVIYQDVGWFNWADYFGLVLKKQWREVTIDEIIDLTKQGLDISSMNYPMISSYIESRTSRIYPTNSFLSSIKISLYDICSKYISTIKTKAHYQMIWGKYQDKLKTFLKKEGISDYMDFNTHWIRLHKLNNDIPGLPKEIWIDFWASYDD